jgi:hypothetical protein
MKDRAFVVQSLHLHQAAEAKISKQSRTQYIVEMTKRSK